LELGETDQVGTYEAQIYFAAISVEKIKLEIDDLLEKQVSAYDPIDLNIASIYPSQSHATKQSKHSRTEAIKSDRFYFTF
jgi:hypothetical protein